MWKIEVLVNGKNQEAYNKLSLIISDFCAELRMGDQEVRTFMDGTFNPNKEEFDMPLWYEIDLPNPPLERRKVEE